MLETHFLKALFANASKQLLWCTLAGSIGRQYPSWTLLLGQISLYEFLVKLVTSCGSAGEMQETKRSTYGSIETSLPKNNNTRDQQRREIEWLFFLRISQGKFSSKANATLIASPMLRALDSQYVAQEKTRESRNLMMK